MIHQFCLENLLNSGVDYENNWVEAHQRTMPPKICIVICIWNELKTRRIHLLMQMMLLLLMKTTMMREAKIPFWNLNKVRHCIVLTYIIHISLYINIQIQYIIHISWIHIYHKSLTNCKSHSSEMITHCCHSQPTAPFCFQNQFGIQTV